VRQWSQSSALGYIIKVLAGGPMEMQSSTEQGRSFKVRALNCVTTVHNSNNRQATVKSDVIAVIRHGCGFEIQFNVECVVACIPMAKKEEMFPGCDVSIQVHFVDRFGII
jgi:hypothetical protein